MGYLLTPEGVKVPAHSVLLQARAQFGPISVKVRRLLSVPKFPYVVGTSGPFRTSGGFLLARLPEGVDFKGPIPDKDYLPGHLLTNGQDDGSGAALRLGAGTQIVGDAKAVGSAQFNAAEVDLRQGQVFQNVPREELPKIRIQDYNPAGRIDPVVLSSDHYTEKKMVSGYASHTGSMSFEHGLQLNGGLLYVEGDVTVGAGGISGDGALICTGHVIVKGAGDFSGSQTTAIVAGGDVRLEGDDRLGSTYQGLIYAGGEGGIPGQDPDLDLQVSKITVSGCLLSNGTGADGHGGTTEVKDARVLYDPRAVDLKLETSLSVVASVKDAGSIGPHLVSSHQKLQSFWDEASQSYRTPALDDLAAWDGVVSYTVQTTDGATRTYDTWAETTANATPSVLLKLRIQSISLCRSISNEVAQAQSTWIGSRQKASVSLDLNKFLQTKDKMRVVWESES